MKRLLTALMLALTLSAVSAALVWSLTFSGDLTGTISASNAASRRNNKNCFEWGNKGPWVGKDWSITEPLAVSNPKDIVKDGYIINTIPAATYQTQGWVCAPYSLPIGITAKVVDMRIDFRPENTINSGYEMWEANGDNDNLSITRTGKNTYQVIASDAIIPTSSYIDSAHTIAGRTTWKFIVDIVA